MRRRLLDNPIARTLLSVWAWLVLGVVVAVWVPLVALVTLVTAPFDPGRYAAGWLFRRLTVVHQVLNPLWRFRRHGTLPPDPRPAGRVVATWQLVLASQTAIWSLWSDIETRVTRSDAPFGRRTPAKLPPCAAACSTTRSPAPC